MSIFDTLFKNIKFDESYGLTGLTDELFCIYLNNILSKKKNILVVTSSLFEANKLKNSLDRYTDKAFLFPMDDFLTSEAIATSPDLLISRLETLNAVLNNSEMIVITNMTGYLHFLPTRKTFENSIINITKDMDFNQNKLIEQLLKIGYKKESIVTHTGEFATRGFILDIFPFGFEHPVRLEFFGDTIDDIREFDEDTQKSISYHKSIFINPYTDCIFSDLVEEQFQKSKYLSLYSKDISSIYDYMDNPIVAFVDYSQIEASYQVMVEEILEYKNSKDVDFNGNYMYDLNEILPDKVIYYMTINNVMDRKFPIVKYYSKSILSFKENVDLILSYLKEQIAFGKTIIICLKDYQIKSFIKYLNVSYVITDIHNISANKINIVDFVISSGFIFEDYIFLTEDELFGIKERKKGYKTSFKYSSKIKNINKLNIGDYIVHNINGIGVYNGIKTLKHGDLLKDYIEVLYAGNDKLYIPVEKIDLISKYAGKDGMVPKVNKLGGNEWKKTKARVRDKIHDIADKLIRLYAERELRKGFAFSKDSELQNRFENNFGYTETRDQLLAIRDIKSDMEAERPMDRLLCGDVGYGKTEVAFRAMFKAVNDSKQVLYLCPTTILSSQQYNNALERFRGFPVNIGLLNRFTTSNEKKRVINGLKDGTIDIVFGTHRLLSDDIKPKDLGLLVIDEEQRFGVTHKEKIKEYKSNVDVLTLTATPIPRTLQMSMVGIRSLSLIETPPVDRYPVQTYVIEENDQIIKEAIYKELSRDGQVFLLYNRVESIEKEVYKIQRLVPEARIVFAHGQLSKTEIEDRMHSFINHDFDILICTTIIETGIDIPNVNTLIILDADRFGLSQLYQIRGRVGRSNRIAYAYLMYNGRKMLGDIAIKRLNVIKDFTELGSGFSIATRDLSIRGAGDILGSEQAGFIDTVGIDLYLKMLNDEVCRLKGETVKEEELQDEKPLLNVSTHIDDSYVDDMDLKIEIHKKINEIDSFDKLEKIKSEIEDRFGKVSEDLIIYMYEEWFEKLANEYQIEKVNQTRNSIEMYFSKDISKKIDGEKLFMDAFKISSMFRFMMKNDRLIVVLDTIKLDKHYVYYLTELVNKIRLTV